VSQIDREFDEDAAYDPGIGPLSLDSNSFEVKWYPAAGGRATEIYAVPLTGGLLFSLAPAPIPGGRRFAYAAVDEHVERWLLTPDASREGVAWLPVKRPGLWTARVFQALARQSGVALPPPECAALPAKADGIATHQSPPLRSVLETTLVNSDNAMAELVLMATARKLSPEVTTLEGAAAELSKYWASHLGGVDWSPVQLVNGSGLTSANRLTAQAVVAVMAHATRERRSADPFRTLLPLSGWRGALRARLDTPDTALDVWAKTGTIDYASAIAGQLTSATGRRVFFAVLISDPDARAEALRQAAAGESASKLDAKAGAWTQSARRLADALIQSWAGRL
jgi:D-alanyl-D-alanine carboxypeptidase/D-alanyl-D-alanine-endopeptidase (penicillin-binding protein 4)